MKAWEDFNCTYRPADKGGLYLKGHRRERRLPNARGSRGLSPSLSSLCLLLSLSLSPAPPFFLPLSPSIMLCRTPPCTISGRRKKKREGKWVRATYFFFSHSSRRQRVVELSSVRRGAGPDGKAGPCRETQPLRTGSAAEATSCKRLVILGRKAANEP